MSGEAVTVTRERAILAKAYRDNGDLGAAYHIEQGADLTPDTQVHLLAIRDALSSSAPTAGDVLVERLKRRATYDYMAMSLRVDVSAAATRIQSDAATIAGQAERIAVLEGALLPFAELAQTMDREMRKGLGVGVDGLLGPYPVGGPALHPTCKITPEALVAARAALATSKGGKDE